MLFERYAIWTSKHYVVEITSNKHQTLAVRRAGVKWASWDSVQRTQICSAHKHSVVKKEGDKTGLPFVGQYRVGFHAIPPSIEVSLRQAEAVGSISLVFG